MKIPNKLAIVILAAGGSSRLGQPKQLVPFKNSTLLNYTIQECFNSGIRDLYVVLGAYSSEIKKTLNKSIVNIIYNHDWEKGLSSSISAAVKEIYPKEYDGIIFTLCDQYKFTSKQILNLIHACQDKKASIILSRYKNGASGPPSYFNISHFSELSQLKGQSGAKSIIKDLKDEITFIPFPDGDLDLDDTTGLNTMLKESEL